MLNTMRKDDITTKLSSAKEGYEFYLKAKVRLAEAGFNLRKFVTNSSDLRNMIGSNEGLPADDYLRLPNGHKVFGVGWNPITDELCFEIKPMLTLA